ncbi:MAG: helix-turn-helix domain-containing protein [Candidatus Brocadiales bacterium]|nr:helix-turn-helix domain-containing protein [Candidatus Bathyanammoxibius sp.]
MKRKETLFSTRTRWTGRPQLLQIWAMDCSPRKLSMLQLAEQLNNISEACRLMGYSRNQLYEIKRAFQLSGSRG